MIKQKTIKSNEKKKIQIIMGIIVIVLFFCGVIKIDTNGNLVVVGFNINEMIDKASKNIYADTDYSEASNGGNNDVGNNSAGNNGTDNSDIKNVLSGVGLNQSFTNEEDLYVYFLDVGQADSILIYNNDETMLIDAGNNDDGKLICDYIKDLGITKIDYLVGTHPHEDHIGGLDNIIKTFEIGKIYMPKKSATTKTFEDVIDAISDKKLKASSPKIGSKFNVGNAVCEIMTKDDDAEDANLSTISIEMTYGTQKYLFTGDMETPNESSRNWNDIDVLKVAHHGSTTSSSKDFLNQTKPEIAIISCGEGNDYGHPHKEILKRLEKINCEVYRTDLLGTILLTSDGTTNELEFLDVSLDGNE